MGHAELSPAKLRAAVIVERTFRFGFCIAAFLVVSAAALSQNLPATASVAVILASDIEFVPPLAKAVVSGDPDQVSKFLKRENIDDRVRAKEGARAGFTPLILAAALSDPEIAQMLIKAGANIAVLDDFHRSAFWYAALHENTNLTNILIFAPKAKDVVNEPDDDFKRTPLHLAVRGTSQSLVELLLKVGASASRAEKDISGETPFDYCKRRATPACKALF